jgi:hypothetical protein
MKPLQSARVRISFVAVLGVALALTTSAAHATTITFDDGNYTTNTTIQTTTTFTDLGYQLTYTPINNGPFLQITSTPGSVIASDGTNAWYSYNNGSLTITQVGGGAFSLTQLDAAQTFTGLNRILDLSVQGVTASGSTISEVITTLPGGADVFHTYALSSAFDDVTSVTISGIGAYPTTEFSLDNLALGAAVTTPLPAALPLFATGLGGLGLLGWRRKRKQATA